MSNKNANVDIEAVEKHELTPHVPPVGVPPGVVGHSIINNSKPLDGTPMDNGGDPESDPPDLSATKETEDCDVGYITQLDKDGNPQLVPIKFEGEAEDEPNPLADFMSGKHRGCHDLFWDKAPIHRFFCGKMFFLQIVLTGRVNPRFNRNLFLFIMRAFMKYFEMSQ